MYIISYVAQYVQEAFPQIPFGESETTTATSDSYVIRIIVSPSSTSVHVSLIITMFGHNISR